MNFIETFTFTSVPHWILIALGFLIALGVTSITIPSIVNISRLKNLCYVPNGRTSHKGSIPTLGGIAVFIGFVLSVVIISGTHPIAELAYIIAGLVIVFFIGIKDDILVIAPVKKLIGQISAVAVIALLADIRITNLYGIFHISELPYIASILLTIFVFIVVINGFNLIDGIDGLASGIGILSASVFGIWFWMYGNMAYAFLSFSFIGALTAFFFFNVNGRKNKLFLGDTGSLITGFVVAVLACKFLQNEMAAPGYLKVPASPAVVFGILIIPLFDSLRVFILRTLKGQSPFKADKQHMHHLLLQLGHTHLQATFILVFTNVVFIVLSYMLRDSGIINLMLIILGLSTMLSYTVVLLNKEKTLREMQPAYIVTPGWFKNVMTKALQYLWSILM